MKEKRYVLINDIIRDKDKWLDNEEICDKLNEFEELRLKKNKKIDRLIEENHLLWDIIDGVKAYFKLEDKL